MVKQVSQKPPAAPKPPAIHPYSVGDPIPVPEAIESDTESAWGRWEDSISPQDDGSDTAFQNTVPTDLPPPPSANSPKRRP
jgi:hypothetical protein